MYDDDDDYIINITSSFFKTFPLYALYGNI